MSAKEKSLFERVTTGGERMLPDVTTLYQKTFSGIDGTIDTPLKSDSGLIGQASLYNQLSLNLRREYNSVFNEGVQLIRQHGSMEKLQQDQIERAGRGEQTWFSRLNQYYQKEAQLFNISRMIDSNEEVFNDSYKSDRENNRLHQIYLDPVNRQPVRNPQTDRLFTVGEYYEMNQRYLGFNPDGTPMSFQPPSTVTPGTFQKEMNVFLKRVATTRKEKTAQHPYIQYLNRYQDPNDIVALQKIGDPENPEASILWGVNYHEESNYEQMAQAQKNFYQYLTQDARDEINEEFYRNYNMGQVFEETVTEEDGNTTKYRIDTPEKYAAMKFRAETSHMFEYDVTHKVVPLETRIFTQEDRQSRMSIFNIINRAVDAGGDDAHVRLATTDQDGKHVYIDMAQGSTKVSSVPPNVYTKLTKALTNMTPDELAVSNIKLNRLGIDQVVHATYGVIDIVDSNENILSIGRRVMRMPAYQTQNGRLINKPVVISSIDGKDVYKDQLYIEIILQYGGYNTLRNSITGVFPDNEGNIKQGKPPRRGYGREIGLDHNNVSVWIPLGPLAHMFDITDATEFNKWIAEVERVDEKNRQVNELIKQSATEIEDETQ